MDDLEEADLKIAEGSSNVEMLSETPESPTQQQIGLDPFFDNGRSELAGPEMEGYLSDEFQIENRKVCKYNRDPKNTPGNEFDYDSNDKLVINEEDHRGDDNDYMNSERIIDQENRNKKKLHKEKRNLSGDDESKVDEETKYSHTLEIYEQNYNKETDGDKEEGELEEGELEDEGEEEQQQEQEEIKENEEKCIEEEEEPKKQELKEEEQKQRKEDKKKETKKDTSSKTEDKREKEERKRKHRDEDEKRKKKKKYYSSEDEEKQKKFPGREKSYDFDTLLKQEMFLVNSSNPEAVYSTDASGAVNNFSTEYSPYKDGGDSYDSGSGEEWDEKPRRRTKRKRRSSRSPSRKNEAICMFYLQGSCKRGNDCPYSHEIAPTRKMELCKFYMMDCCAKKEKCLYMHKDFPCKYYHFGMKCKAGDQCKFSHDPLQEITKNILLKHIELAPKDILGDFPRVSKHSAQIIISITEAKRKGENYEAENLDSLLVLEGKGFKYLDKVLKNVRKKKNGDKKEKERERENKDERERSPKRSKSREEHRDSDKDKEREKEKEREREKDRDKEEKKDRERERDKERYRNRDNRDRERTRERRRHRSKGEYSVHKHRAENDRLQQQQQQHYQQHGRREEARERDFGRSLEGPGTSHGMLGQSMEPDTKWYSSDEECDMNNTQAMRRNQNNSPPQMRRQRIEESSHGPPTHGQFSLQPNLPDIDVMYLKNVLSAVQSQSSQNQNLSPMKEDRSNNNLWEQNNKRYSSSDNRTSLGYMDISNDIKEVFYEEPKESLRGDQFSSNLDSFLQRARSKSLSSRNNYKDDFRETNVNSRDFKFQNSLERSWSQNNSNIPRDGRDMSHHSPIMKQEFPSGDNDKNFESGRYPREDNSWDNKRIHDDTIPFNGLPFSDKDNINFQDRTSNAKKDTDLRIFTGSTNRQTDNFTDRNDNASSSIYDFDIRLIDSINSSINSDDRMSDLPFKVPLHSSAKEIDASYNNLIPIVYQLIRVDIPKPDFSKIKINQEDKRIMEDPRLRKMLRSSLESPLSPRENFEISPDNSIRSPTTEFKESRDPRKIAASRDPRTEGKSMTRADPRPDPRMVGRADPRCVNPRVDPRMDTRDPRMDMREPLLDSNLRDADPRAGNQMYPNGMMDGHSFQQFLNSNMSATLSPDPRGKPGLLGPAPSPKRVPVGLSGSINQGIGPNPFLLPQPMGNPSGQYNMNNDRGDIMPGPGPPFPQSHWGNSGGGGGGGGRMNINDPRLNRDFDMGS